MPSSNAEDRPQTDGDIGDDHIHFNCEAVVGYAEAKAWKDERHPNLSMRDLCFSSNPQVVEWRDEIPDDEGFAMWAVC